MAQLRPHYPAIQAAGADVLLVTFFPPDRTVNWARNHKLPFRLASDVTRYTYRRYGLGDADSADLINPAVVLAGAKAFFRTRVMAYPTQHYEQTGGYFVVDDRGTILYARPSKGPADHPQVGELLKALSAHE